ncbi:hypothetical protein [Brachyspira hyodysenteriae]|uniref:hypothetical protein n=1 Tax=Brachyspira hyodysenteriae TaxID=159 RepID=UPI0022CD548D|nr:hypothetical protein [Brachyspira hyodysenteriae]MCZ9967360.1 hypothetical protein [Brachyspira hyodysenteriae]MDA0011200.1 hypothetical protein [Brachyspira hyodysenteriae]MDA0032234.1 hypothetical protein [Brachyspira hyodysenteriae]MDA0077400.1 hypothetical protein [Brachyspira hyodysenteriae]MDA0077913.1 hypothetical protein [Brachyspira hyodysenteriae]
MNNKEKRIISKIFTRLFFTYKKDMAVMENEKDKSIIFCFTIENFYHNGKSRDFNLIYKKKIKDLFYIAKEVKKLYSSNCLNEVLHYLKNAANLKN